MSDYWKRRNETLKDIKAQLKSDEDYKREIERIYGRAQTNIQKEINNELMRYAGDNNLSMSKAQKKIDSIDVQQFKDKLEDYKNEKDLSPRAKDELKRFNIQTRMNRNELLKHNIQLDTIALADKEDKMLTSRLIKDVGDKYKRMSGLLGETVPSPDQLNRLAKRLVEADYKGTNFSNRVWANQKDLQHGLEKALERTMIQGKHPNEGARDLRKLVSENFENKKYVAERIAVTEGARIQDETQRAAFDDYGVKQYEWIAEPDACGECAEYDGNIYKLNDPSAPRVPAHPFCRCSIAGYVDRESIFTRVEEKEDAADVWESRKAAQREKLGDFKSSKSIGEANAYAEDVLGINQAGFHGLDPRVADDLNKSIYEHVIDFPELQDRVKFTGSVQERNKRIREDFREHRFKAMRAMPSNSEFSDEIIRKKAAEVTRDQLGFLTPPDRARAISRSAGTHSVVDNYAGVTFNNKMGNSKNYNRMMEVYKLDREHRWSSKGSASPKGTMDHELGHQLDDMLGIRDIKEVQELYDSRTKEELTKDLSEYSHNNNNPDIYREMIAEAWAEYRNNPKPREIAKTIGEIIEEEYIKQMLEGGN